MNNIVRILLNPGMNIKKNFSIVIFLSNEYIYCPNVNANKSRIERF